MKILIMGIGNMGFAVAKALHRRPEDFRVHVHDPWSRFLGDARGLGMTVHDSTGDFEGGAWDAVLAAVKPNGMKAALESLKPMREGGADGDFHCGGGENGGGDGGSRGISPCCSIHADDCGYVRPEYYGGVSRGRFT